MARQQRSYRMALITGATSGIGTAFAEQLPPDTGLLLSGRNEARLEELRLRHGREGRIVETVVADLTRAEDRRHLMDRAAALEIDLLINNAGFGLFGRVVENDRQRELDMVTVNVTAVVDLTRTLLPGMIANARRTRLRAGVIIVSSTAAFVATPLMATYAATKAFELSFTEALAEELLDDPVNVLALCPGATRTDFFRRAGATADGFYGSPEEPAEVVRKALAALGRQRVLVSRAGQRVALAPITVSRGLIVAGVGRFMRRVARRSGG